MLALNRGYGDVGQQELDDQVAALKVHKNFSHFNFFHVLYVDFVIAEFTELQTDYIIAW